MGHTNSITRKMIKCSRMAGAIFAGAAATYGRLAGKDTEPRGRRFATGFPPCGGLKPNGRRIPIWR